MQRFPISPSLRAIAASLWSINRQIACWVWPIAKRVMVLVVILWVLAQVGIRIYTHYYFDELSVKRLLVEEIKAKSQLNFFSDTVRIEPTLFKGVRIRVDNPKLQLPNEQYLLNAKRFEAFITYQDLIRGRLRLSTITMMSPYIYLNSYAMNHLYRVLGSAPPSSFLEDVSLRIQDAEWVLAPNTLGDGWPQRSLQLTLNSLEMTHLKSRIIHTAAVEGKLAYGIDTMEPSARWVQVSPFVINGKFMLQGDVRHNSIHFLPVDVRLGDKHDPALRLAGSLVLKPPLLEPVRTASSKLDKGLWSWISLHSTGLIDTTALSVNVLPAIKAIFPSTNELVRAFLDTRFEGRMSPRLTVIGPLIHPLFIGDVQLDKMTTLTATANQWRPWVSGLQGKLLFAPHAVAWHNISTTLPHSHLESTGHYRFPSFVLQPITSLPPSMTTVRTKETELNDIQRLMESDSRLRQSVLNLPKWTLTQPWLLKGKVAGNLRVDLPEVPSMRTFSDDSRSVTVSSDAQTLEGIIRTTFLLAKGAVNLREIRLLPRHGGVGLMIPQAHLARTHQVWTLNKATLTLGHLPPSGLLGLLQRSPNADAVITLKGQYNPVTNATTGEFESSHLKLNALNNTLSAITFPMGLKGAVSSGVMDIQGQWSGLLNAPLLVMKGHLANLVMTLHPLHSSKPVQLAVPLSDWQFDGRRQALALESTQINLDGLQSRWQGVICTGHQGQTCQVTGQLASMSLASLQRVLALLSADPATAKAMKSLDFQRGTVSGNLAMITGGAAPQFKGQLGVQQLQLWVPLWKDTIKATSATFNLEGQRIALAHKTPAFLGPYPFQAQGYWDFSQGYDLSFFFKRLPISLLRDDKQRVATWLPAFKAQQPLLYQAVGQADLGIHITPKITQVNTDFYHAGVSMKGVKYPMYDVNGRLQMVFNGKRMAISTHNLGLRYGNSPVHLDFELDSTKDLYIAANGTLAPLVLTDMLRGLAPNLEVNAAVPFDVDISGHIGQLQPSTKVPLGQGTDITSFININVASLLRQPGLKHPSSQNDQASHQAYLSAMFHWINDRLDIEQMRFGMGPDSGLLVQGQITDLFDPLKIALVMQLHTQPVLKLVQLTSDIQEATRPLIVATRPFSAGSEAAIVPAEAVGQPTELVEGLSGEVAADVIWRLAPTENSLNGYVKLDHVRSEKLHIQDLNGTLTMSGNQGELSLSHLKLPGVDTELKATIMDWPLFPLTLTNVDVHAQQFQTTDFTQWMDQTIFGKVRKNIWTPYFIERLGEQAPLFFEVHDGNVTVKELIVDNMVLENFTSSVQLFANGYLEFPDFKASSVGGHVSGSFAMNPRDDNFMTVQLNIDKMKANALAETLLGISNQVFGDVSGSINYTTEGQSRDEMFNNVTGSANIKIEKGRLPQLVKIENMLVAANGISGGLVGLNVNSLFGLLAPLQSNRFTEFAGTFKIAQGVAYTDDLVSQGEALSMAISGSSRLSDGFSSMHIDGTVNDKASSMLGRLGGVSFSRLLGVLPPLRRLISWIPGLGYLPGFGKQGNTGNIGFEVELQGLMTDPSSMKSFRWKRATRNSKSSAGGNVTSTPPKQSVSKVPNR